MAIDGSLSGNLLYIFRSAIVDTLMPSYTSALSVGRVGGKDDACVGALTRHHTNGLTGRYSMTVTVQAR